MGDGEENGEAVFNKFAEKHSALFQEDYADGGE